MTAIDTTLLNRLIVGRIDPHIYAFSTNTVPNYLKVGDTYRPVSVRIGEWRDRFPDLRHDKEWEWKAMTAEGKYFRDFAVHYYLETIRGLHRLLPTDIEGLPYYSREFFEDATPEDVNLAIDDIEHYAGKVDGTRQYQYFSEERLPEELHFERTDNYPPRPNQDETIKRFVAARKAGRKNLLMYAVMRFGKSFTSMCCATAMEAKIVLILSAKADVRMEWKRTVESHVRFKDYSFLDSISLMNDPQAITHNLEKGKRVALFLTLQDLMGDDIKEKHVDLFRHTIDLLIVDETHFGARAEEYGKVLRNANKLNDTQIKREFNASGECSFDDLEEALSLMKSLNVDITLHLSGTPYRILMGSEFKSEDIIAFYQFTDIIDDKEKWDKDNINNDNYKEWDNPYYGFPQMIRFAFNPNESAQRLIERLKKEGKSSQLNELFRPVSISKDTSRNKKHKHFLHDKEVIDLLYAIDGSKADDNVLGFLDYSKLKEGKMCRHIVMVLPFCASCDAMEELLHEQKDVFRNLCDYEIINIAGLESHYTSNEAIKAKIKSIEKLGQKSISLTVNRMLTGSTVPEWDTMLFLKDVSSPQEYDQAIFRLQNQYVTTYKAETGETIKYDMKPQTLLVDFAPDRMFFMQEQKSKIYNVNTNERGNDELEKRLKREMEISPIIVLNKGIIHQVTPVDIMNAVREYSADKTVMDEATTVPTDQEMLSDEYLWDMIKDFAPIDSKKGLNLKPHEGEGDKYEEPDEEPADNVDTGNIDTGKGTQLQGKNNATVDDEKRDKRLAAFFARILFFALLTDDNVKSLQQIKEAIKQSESNKRIARNVGLNFQKLSYLHRHINPFVLSELDYKISNINDLLHDTTFSPVERVERALKKFGRLSVSEIVTPSNIADEVVALLPVNLFGTDCRFLDIASKQGEFACALYKRLGAERRKNIFALPTSNLSYEFTRKVFELLNIPIDNIITEFNAYDIIGNNKETIIEKLKNMKFDAIIGNPPYQEMGDNNNRNLPIYHMYVDASKNATKRYSSLIIPARWYTPSILQGGFTQRMLDDKNIAKLVDYCNAAECFTSVEIKGGLCYYLSDKCYNSECDIETHHANKCYKSRRFLRTKGLDAFVRYPQSLSIIKKVTRQDFRPLSEIVSSQNPFGFNSKVVGTKTPFKDSVIIFSKFRNIGYIKRDDISLRQSYIDKWKVMTPIAGEGGTLPHRITGRPFVSKPGECCNGTYMVIGPFDNQAESENAVKYLHSKFARFMVSIVQNTQNTKSDSYRLVPIQDFSKSWTDTELYQKYGLTEDEIQFIESMVRPM